MKKTLLVVFLLITALFSQTEFDREEIIFLGDIEVQDSLIVLDGTLADTSVWWDDGANLRLDSQNPVIMSNSLSYHLAGLTEKASPVVGDSVAIWAIFRVVAQHLTMIL